MFLLQRFDALPVVLLDLLLVLLQRSVLLLRSSKVGAHNRYFSLLLLRLLPELVDGMLLLLIHRPQLLRVAAQRRSAAGWKHLCLLLNSIQLRLYVLINRQRFPPVIVEALVALLVSHDVPCAWLEVCREAPIHVLLHSVALVDACRVRLPHGHQRYVMSMLPYES